MGACDDALRELRGIAERLSALGAFGAEQPLQSEQCNVVRLIERSPCRALQMLASHVRNYPPERVLFAWQAMVVNGLEPTEPTLPKVVTIRSHSAAPVRVISTSQPAFGRSAAVGAQVNPWVDHARCVVDVLIARVNKSLCARDDDETPAAKLPELKAHADANESVPTPAKAHPEPKSTKAAATPEHPALTLFHALNALHTVCSNAGAFRELAERRAKSREMQLNFLNLRAKIASDRANELARAGAPMDQQRAALSEGMDPANDPQPSNEPVEYTKSLRENILDHGQTWCERARAAMWAGGAKGLDAATQANAAGQARSIELHTKLQDVERVFVGLTIGVGDPRIIIDKDAASMADLGEWFARTRDEMGAVFETRGLDGDDLIARLAVAPTPPILSDDELARLRSHLKAPLRLSAMKDNAERDRWRTLHEVLNYNDELRADARGTPTPRRAATPKATRRERRAKWLAEAMLTVQDHPEWSDATIAERVGIDKSRLSRSPVYRAAARMARTPKTPAGSVTVANGDRELEAVDDSFDPNRRASRQWQDEQDTDDRIDREMKETQRKTQRGGAKTPVNRRSGGA